MSGFIIVIILSRAHLILTYLSGYNGVAFSELVEFFDHILRLDNIFLIISQSLCAFPAMNLIEPFFSLFVEIAEVFLLKEFVKLAKSDLAIAHNRNSDRNILADGCWININVYDLGIGRKGIYPAGNTVIKTNADR